VKLGGLGWLLILFVSLLPAAGTALADSSQAEEPADMVLMPAGEFLMGSAEGPGRKDEYPQHTVYLDAYWIDRYEVTGGDFEKYLAQNPKQHPTITGWYDRKVRPGMERKPVIGLTWKRCQNYCLWRGKRLLTEAEWERAAGGTNHRTYPWGEELPDETRSHFYRCCFIDKGDILREVGSLELGKTPEGVYEMSGNIAEWVFDWYDARYYQKSPGKNPQGPTKGTYHVVRGGAWNSLPDYMRVSHRYGQNDGQEFYGIGCRCAKSHNLKD
jgi:formylglycine-generating enzyme required for sulfatase activity